jgi:hypothetical protein
VRGPWLGRTYTDGILTQGHRACNEGISLKVRLSRDDKLRGAVAFCQSPLRFDANSLGLELCPDTTMAQRRIATTAW